MRVRFRPRPRAGLAGAGLLLSGLLLSGLALAGCGSSYSPDTYASSAVQQANKVEQGEVVGVRKVAVEAAGTTGAVAGAAAGAAVGSQTGTGVGTALSSIGGSLVGGLLGAGAERVAGDTFAYEYIVRKPNKELVSVTQKDAVPLTLGQKVLVISGPQARIVADYTVAAEPAPSLTVIAPAAPAPPSEAAAKPAP